MKAGKEGRSRAALQNFELKSGRYNGNNPKDGNEKGLRLNYKGMRSMEQLLIIEDDTGLNQGLSKALKADHRQIISCQNLKAAREQLLCGNVSLILLDISLPDGSGLDFLREMKEKASNIPVILLTANDTDIDIVDGLERGADDYITKPFSLSVLRARVNTQLRKSGDVRERDTFRTNRYCFDFSAALQ